MTLLDLQQRIREAGRIRIGAKEGNRPTKLETFRVTSPDRVALEGIAELYGGTPEPWDAPAGPQHQVVTESDELHVIVPPTAMAFSQHYELWSGGGCQRRCDSVTESISEEACLCDPEDRECKPRSRLSVMIRDLPGLGVWRLDTQGWYAAQELASAVAVVHAAAGAGAMIPARLRLEQRKTKRSGEQVRRFAVPVLDLEVTPAQLLAGGAGEVSLPAGQVRTLGGTEAVPVLPAGSNLTPVPESVQVRPAASVADQFAAVDAEEHGAKRRKGAQEPIRRTGLKPRTAAQVAEVDLSAVAEAIEAAQAAGVEGDYEATLAWASESQAHADKAAAAVRGKLEDSSGGGQVGEDLPPSEDGGDADG